MQLFEIDSGSDLYDEVTAAVDVEQSIQRRRVVPWVEPASSGLAAARVGDDDGVAADRVQRIGAADVDVGDVVPGHRQPDRVDIAADHVGCRIAQCRKLCADRARHVVHARSDEPPSAVRGHRLGGGLLQRLVGEQPRTRVGELGCRLAAKQRRLHQHRRPLAESCSRRSDVGDQGGVGEPVVGDLAQRLRSGLAAQESDVGYAELYDGLTPVTRTL